MAIIFTVFLLRVIGFSLHGVAGFDIARSFNFDSVILLGVLYAFAMQARALSAGFSVMIFALFSFLHFFPFFAPTLVGFFSFKDEVRFTAAVLGADLVVCFLVSLLTLQNILESRVRRMQKEEIVSTTKRQPSRFEALLLLGLAILLVTLLGLLLLLGGKLSTLNLWLTLVAFLIMVAFSLPFFLIFFGLIGEKTWLAAFRKVVGRLPVLARSEAEAEKIVESQTIDLSKDNSDRADTGNGPESGGTRSEEPDGKIDL